jgi:hypothetical protein
MESIIHVFSFITFLFDNFIEKNDVFYFVNLENTTLILNIYTTILKFNFLIFVFGL